MYTLSNKLTTLVKGGKMVYSEEYIHKDARLCGVLFATIFGTFGAISGPLIIPNPRLFIPATIAGGMISVL